jgi:hypothetical protein
VLFDVHKSSRRKEKLESQLFQEPKDGDAKREECMGNIMSPPKKLKEENYMEGHEFSQKYSDVQHNELEGNKFEFQLEFEDENFP